ncbi:MAG TPA: GNAT family N-acetyltransferase [Thermoanaerobaculia bacterium]
MIRKARHHDLPAIERVMRESLKGLGAPAYDAHQIASALVWIARPDAQLIDDETYFVVEEEGEVVACGGWSKRGKLFTAGKSAEGESRLLDPATEPARIRAFFVHPQWARRGLGRQILEASEREAREAGFRRCELMAMLSGGEQMYLALGYTPIAPAEITLGDGVVLGGTLMTKEIT